MESRIAKVLVEEAGFTKNTTAADVQYWVKKRYTSYFSVTVLKIIENNASRVASYINDYWEALDSYNADASISRSI